MLQLPYNPRSFVGNTQHIPWTDGVFGNNLMMAAMAVMMTKNPQAFCNEIVYLLSESYTSQILIMTSDAVTEAGR